jgi:multiple sugar transport system substrate-binding protein
MDLSFFTNSRRLIYILVGGIIVLVFITIVILLRGVGGSSQQQANLEFWGVFDGTSAFQDAIDHFEKQYPGVNITYRLFPYAEYERRVVDALAAGTGPDIWMIHHTWVPKHQAKLAPLPEKISGLKNPLMTVKEYQDTFVDVAVSDFIKDGKIYAMPLYMDTLALYYNKDLLNAAGITRPPKTWEEFNADVELLAKLDASRNIIQAGAAMGTATNINRSTDILMALMLQSGVQMTNPDNGEATFARSVNNQRVGEVAVQYYTDFSNPSTVVYTWNESMHYSIDAFTEGSTAMMLNYAHQQDVIRGKSARINFSIAPMPQISQDAPRTYANYWAPAVSAASKNIGLAWQFVSFITSHDEVISYLNETQRPSARRDVIAVQKDDLTLGVFAQQALTAQSWFQADNVANENIFSDLINDVIHHERSITDAIQRAEDRVSVLMSKK